MDAEIIKKRLAIVLPLEMESKISVNCDENGHILVVMDLHGLSKREAKRITKNVILVMRGSFTLALIHGYNNGTVLKEYIHNELRNARIQKRYCKAWNPGETFLDIA